MGYVLLSFSTGTQFGIEMLLFYLVIYMLSGIAVWFIVLAVRENKTHYSNKFNKELGDFALLRKSNPALAVSLSVAMFSIAGIPPLIGFFAKLGVFLSILYVEYYIVALLAVLCSVVSTFYYIRIIKILYFENILVGKLYHPIKTNKIFFFTASIFALFLLFLNPTLMYIIIHNVVWRSFYGF
jgi:NADH-quinone oxidoreductase subunit N